MPFGDILYTLLIQPLEEFFRILFFAVYGLIPEPGIIIILLSLIMNCLLLPLYHRADLIQEEAIATEKKMKPYVEHIKKHFKGDERFMLLSTCYRQNHYKPTDALKGLTPLLLEIPFFMAAYHFLSGLSVLRSASFGPIQDLSMADAMLRMGSLSINVLPVCMTLINLVSSAVYTKDAPRKTKFQLYGMAAVFLVLLYNSPSGLVLYWTLNNLFSLVKNVVVKSSKPRKITGAILVLGSLAGLLFTWKYGFDPKVRGILSLCFLGIAVAAAIFCRKPGEASPAAAVLPKENNFVFFSGCLVLTVLVGLLIPSSVVCNAPEEFVELESGMGPNTAYVLHTFLLAAGTFLVWLGLFYGLANQKIKKKMALGIWILSGIAIVDYMFFGTGYGTLSNQLIYDVPFVNSASGVCFNLAVILTAGAGIYLLLRKKPGFLTWAAPAVLIAMSGLSVFNMMESQKAIANATVMQDGGNAVHEDLFRISRHGKNVVVLMTDQAIGGYIPYIFEERPELAAQFAGFTYYPNTVSFGPKTNFGLPAVMGGYEYIPVESNQRLDMTLGEKHNEALKVMPVLFDSNGFEVTVCDPTYAGYRESPDLSIFDDYPEIRKFITKGRYKIADTLSIQNRQHNFFLYSLMKISPVFMHSYLYNNGKYLYGTSYDQICYDGLTADGIPLAFSESYSVLENLPNLTQILDGSENTFQSMCNDATHSKALLQLPDYTLSSHVDNSAYDEYPAVRRNAEGNTLVLDNPTKLLYYHSNVANYMEIGKWLDYLRENDVYDNTRIIIVSDHGFRVETVSKEIAYTDTYSDDLSKYNPVLLVKDFGATEWKTDPRLMTNADVPALAAAGLIADPANPFTGKPLNSDYKTREPLYICASYEWDIAKNHGIQYLDGPWLSFAGQSVMDPDSWKYAGYGALPEKLQ